MNKRFFTLLTSFLLAFSFMISAQVTETGKYENGKFYLLGDGDRFLTITGSEAAGWIYKAELKANVPTNDLYSLNNYLWEVEVVKASATSLPEYTFINRKSGLKLSFDSSITGTVADTQMNGNISSWLNGVSSTEITGATPLYYYLDDVNVIYMAKSGDVVYANKTKVSTLFSASSASNVFDIQPYKLDDFITLSASDLNYLLQTNQDSKEFALTFSNEVSEGQTNLFTASELTAVGITGSSYVKLTVDRTKDDKYIVVDTAYYEGTENKNKLIKLTTDKLNSAYRLPASYNFLFTYNVLENKIYIQSQGYLTKVTDKSNTKDGSWWVEVSDGLGGIANQVTNAYVYIANLLDVSVLTFYDYTVTTAAVPTVDNQNTEITLGYSLKGLVPATIEKGIYTIQYNSERSAPYFPNNAYLMANLKGTTRGWVLQVENQDFARIPAAHWAVEKRNTSSSTSAVKIINREFNEDWYWPFSEYTQFYAVEGSSNTFFYFNGTRKDTITFTRVDDKDKKIGYKYLTKDEMAVEKYRFNYLHGLVMDKSLAGGENGIYVNAEEEYLIFSLEDAVRDDVYGYDELIRNAYYLRVSNSKFKEGSYLAYNNLTRKYYVKELEDNELPQAFFLKENNYVAGTTTPYYALIEANTQGAYFSTFNTTTQFYASADATYPISADIYGAIHVPVYDKNGKQENLRFVTDNNIEFYVYTKNERGVVVLTKVNTFTSSIQFGEFYTYYDDNDIEVGAINSYYSYNYAAFKASVDDNSLVLTRGSLEDKFIANEIRTSAFAVIPDDSPLYRRFDDKDPSETGDAQNSPVWLKFFGYNNNAEMLGESSPNSITAEEAKYRQDLSAEGEATISFLTMPNTFQFPEKDKETAYTFYVDTAYVRNNTVMPQYMIALRPDFAEGDTIWCEDTNHATVEEWLDCVHTKVYPRVVKAEYLYNAQDSVKNADYLGKESYGALNKTRLAFVEGAHVGDTLYLLRGKNAGMTAQQVQHILSNRNYAQFPKEDKIFLGNNNHKNYVFSFRLLDDNNKRFLIESVGNQIAPVTEKGGWLQNINGVMVIVEKSDTAYGLAEIFDVEEGAEGLATSNDKVVTTDVKVIAAESKITILNASGKKVVINNILGQTVANTVLTSDNASIAAPKGIVVVAIEGEEAVKAIVK